MIEPNTLSVIVQGAIDPKLTPLCMQSIRDHLPGTEIILSTWNDSKIGGLDYDSLVLNADPGAKKHDFVYDGLNNTNRQLVSIQGGLRKASRPYCLKLRTDAFLKGAGFLRYWDSFPARDAAYTVFERRILTGTVYSRESACEGGAKMPTPFHPSDLWFMGLTSDLQKYFAETAVMPEGELAQWAYKYPNRLPYHTPSWRYAPEQYYLVSYLKRCSGLAVSFDDWSDWNPDNMWLSQNILYNNFVFLGLHQSGIHNRKHTWALKYDDRTRGLITYDLFRQRYKEFCDPDYVVDAIDKDRLRLRKTKDKIRSNVRTVLAPVRGGVTWISSACNLIFLSVKYVRDYVLFKGKHIHPK